MLLGALQQPQLGPCAHKVVQFVLCFVVSVAVDVVGQEPHALHIGEQRGGVWQMIGLDRQKETARRLDVSARECTEYVHVEADVLKVRIVLKARVRGRAEEVAVVGEDIVGHHRVEVYHAEHASVLVEHDVVHFRVAVAHTLGQHAFAVKTLGHAHVFGSSLHLAEYVAHALHASGGVGLDGITQLAQTELHVVEVGDDFARHLRHVGKHGLEVSESQTGTLRVVGVHYVERPGARNEHRHAPVVVALAAVGISVVRSHHGERLAADVALARLAQLAAYVVGHDHDVALQHVNVGEYGGVDALQYIVGRILLGGRHLVGVVYQSRPERLNAHGCALGEEM